MLYFPIIPLGHDAKTNELNFFEIFEISVYFKNKLPSSNVTLFM